MRKYPPDNTDLTMPLPRRTATELRSLYEKNPTDELRHALWEIHRLQNMALAILERLEAQEAGALQNQVAWVIARILEEPCVEEAQPTNYKKRYQIAIENSGRHWAKDALANAEAQRRGEADKKTP